MGAFYRENGTDHHGKHCNVHNTHEWASKFDISLRRNEETNWVCITGSSQAARCSHGSPSVTRGFIYQIASRIMTWQECVTRWNNGTYGIELSGRI